MLVKIDPRTNAVAEKVALRAVLTVDYGVVAAYGAQLRGVKVNDLSPLWPRAHLRAAVLKGAKQFTADMERRGYRLLTNESDIRVFGPYHARGWRQSAGGNLVATGRQEGETEYPESCDLLIVGDFIATRALPIEAAPRPAWATEGESA